MKIQCPHCGVKGSADDSYHGQKLKCPRCQGIFAALPNIAESPPPAPSLVEGPLVPGDSNQQAIGEDAVEASHQLPDMADDIFAADSVAPIVAPLSPPAGEEGDEKVFEASALAGDEAPVIDMTPHDTALAGMQEAGNNDLDKAEHQPYGMDKEQCWQCGKKDSVGVPFIAKDGRLYCSDCLPAEKPEHDELGSIPTGLAKEGAGRTDISPEEQRYGFTIGGLLKEAWAKTKGVKAAVWAGSAVMYLVLLVLATGGAFLLPSQADNSHGLNIPELLSDMLFLPIMFVIFVIFSAGLFFIGIRKVAGETITWKMVFEGFSVAGKLIVVSILQALLIGIGFLLLILPGIYLAVGYAMTLPLIVDRKMSPWQAMEASRKAIHGEWWKVFGLSIVMCLILMVSSLPLGLGLIWTLPMFVVLGGVVYRSLFGIEKRVG